MANYPYNLNDQEVSFLGVSLRLVAILQRIRNYCEFKSHFWFKFIATIS
ncbi:149_t:CDS:2 [Gigaspora rosea]|nr:149_t:CDS:2 [Gigaspora rosea]